MASPRQHASGRDLGPAPPRIPTLLWLHVPVLFVYALLRGQSTAHSLFEAGAVAAFAGAAAAGRAQRRLSTVAASFGLLTSSAMLSDSEGMITRLEALKALGVKLALDDFGTGYSSFSYLQRLPIDVLKIDRAFVGLMETGEKRSTLAQAIVSLAHTMDLVAVAEGVETSAQAEMLGRIGCDQAQGFYLARPMDADAVEAILGEGQVPAGAARP